MVDITRSYIYVVLFFFLGGFEVGSCHVMNSIQGSEQKWFVALVDTYSEKLPECSPAPAPSTANMC